MATELELQHRSELADARLGVAEQLGWIIALLGGAVVYLKLDSWLVAIGVAVVLYVVAILKYRREAAKAEDEYYRVAGLGKYATTSTDGVA